MYVVVWNRAIAPSGVPIVTGSQYRKACSPRHVGLDARGVVCLHPKRLPVLVLRSLLAKEGRRPLPLRGRANHVAARLKCSGCPDCFRRTQHLTLFQRKGIFFARQSGGA